MLTFQAEAGNSKVTYHLWPTWNRSLLIPDTHHRPTLGVALQERLKGVGQFLEGDHARDLVQVPQAEVAALREPAPQLAPRLDLKPVGVYAEEVYAPQDEGHDRSLESYPSGVPAHGDPAVLLGGTR
jgi:hypothetical protein